MHVSPCGAAEPQAAFVLNDGWAELGLKREGQPIANAGIQVIDEKGVNFAEGQTGEDGHASFPLPRGSSCVVEIKIGNRTADPIRLFKTKEGVEPARVLLSYGLRPCCRFKSRSQITAVETPVKTPVEPPTAPKDFVPDWLLLGSALTLLSVAATIVFVAKRPLPDSSVSSGQ